LNIGILSPPSAGWNDSWAYRPLTEINALVANMAMMVEKRE